MCQSIKLILSFKCLSTYTVKKVFLSFHNVIILRDHSQGNLTINLQLKTKWNASNILIGIQKNSFSWHFLHFLLKIIKQSFCGHWDHLSTTLNDGFLTREYCDLWHVKHWSWPKIGDSHSSDVPNLQNLLVILEFIANMEFRLLLFFYF